MNGLAQGTSSITRIGQNIMMKSIHLKFYLRAPQLQLAPNSQVYAKMARILIVYDLQPNGALPLGSDLLDNSTTGVGIVSSLNKLWTERFRILFDKRYFVHSMFAIAGGASASSQALVYDEVYLKVNHLTQFANTSTGTYSDIRTGALWLVALSDNAAAAEQPLFTYFSRVRFVDN